MNKGERISQFVAQIVGEDADVLRHRTDSLRQATGEMAHHPFYRAYFECWNAQRYYEAHDVLEQLWLNTQSSDDNFFKGLIQAAGAFVHLQKNFEHPMHTKHSQRLRPAVRLFALAENNLTPYSPTHHALDVAAFVDLLRTTREKILRSDYQTNPWSPAAAPKLKLL